MGIETIKRCISPEIIDQFGITTSRTSAIPMRGSDGFNGTEIGGDFAQACHSLARVRSLVENLPGSRAIETVVPGVSSRGGVWRAGAVDRTIFFRAPEPNSTDTHEKIAFSLSNYNVVCISP